MNSLKFRAWYKVNKKMYDVLTLDIIDKKVLIENNEDKEKPLRGYVKISEVELMQSTGLKDRSGAEIFEGDIVESRASQNKEDWKRWKVYFEDGSFVFEHKWIIRKKEYSMKEFLCEDEIEFYHLEVIGNIYENPELLEGVEQ